MSTIFSWSTPKLSHSTSSYTDYIAVRPKTDKYAKLALLGCSVESVRKSGQSGSFIIACYERQFKLNGCDLETDWFTLQQDSTTGAMPPAHYIWDGSAPLLVMNHVWNGYATKVFPVSAKPGNTLLIGIGSTGEFDFRLQLILECGDTVNQAKPTLITYGVLNSASGGYITNANWYSTTSSGSALPGNVSTVNSNVTIGDASTEEKQETECKCESLLWGHRNTCPLYRR